MDADVLSLPMLAREASAQILAAHGREVAEARIALRPRAGHRVTARERDLAIDTVIRAFDGADRIQLQGFADRPVVHASYSGPGCSVWAAGSVQHAADQVRHLGSFTPAGSVAEGAEEVADTGARVRVGDPTEAADRLCQRAAPGQILLAGEGWSARRQVAALPATGTSGAGAVTVWVLREVGAPG